MTISGLTKGRVFGEDHLAKAIFPRPPAGTSPAPSRRVSCFWGNRGKMAGGYGGTASRDDEVREVGDGRRSGGSEAVAEIVPERHPELSGRSGLRDDLVAKTYKPQPVRRVMI